MPFAYFSGPPNRLREHARTLFRGMSYAVCSFFGSTQSSSGANPKVFRGKSYAVCLFFGSTQSSSGANPTVFSGEVLCRLLIFRVRASAERKRKLRRRKSYAVCSLCTRKFFLGKSYAVCSFFGSTQAFSGANPKAFFEEVLCRLLIFRVRTPFGI